MADPAAPRMTEAERALTHALCFCAVSRIHDDRLQMLIDGMRQALTQLPPRDQTVRLRQAAQSVVEAYPRRTQPAGAADWVMANLQASSAAQDFHWRAFCALAPGA